MNRSTANPKAKADKKKPKAPKKQSKAPKKQSKGPPPNWKKAFLRALERSGVVATACATAKISRKTVYQLRSRSAEWRGEWDEALENAIDGMEDECRRRGVTGVLKPIYQGGKKVGEIREYSDTLLMFLLRGKRPEIYAGLNEKKLAELLTERFSAYFQAPAHESTPPRPPALALPNPDPDEE